MAKVKESTPLTKIPAHVAFIMDGNGRWAQKRLLPRSLGHKAGVKRVREIIDLCFHKYGIKAVSLFCFSTENWNRPEKEISYLFNLLRLFFQDNIDRFIKEGVKVEVSGKMEDERIPLLVRSTILEAVEKTKEGSKHIFNVLFDYGGREEISQACRKISQQVLEGKLNIDDINPSIIDQNLYQNDLPPLDLLVRTSGELRVSNCLLWELAYAEMVFPEVLWPDFDEKALLSCLYEYQGRKRRFGGLKNE